MFSWLSLTHDWHAFLLVALGGISGIFGTLFFVMIWIRYSEENKGRNEVDGMGKEIKRRIA